LSCYSHLSSCPCQAMKTNRAVQLQLCSLTLAPVGAISFTLQQFCPRAKCPRTHWVGLKTSLDFFFWIRYKSMVLAQNRTRILQGPLPSSC